MDGSERSGQRFLLAFALIVIASYGCSTSKISDTSLELDDPATTQIEIEFPNGDPSVAASDGGPGFAPASDSGWETDNDFATEGSSDAVNGGTVRYWVRFPLTLRVTGKDSTAGAVSIVKDLCYESLLTRHPPTNDAGCLRPF